MKKMSVVLGAVMVVFVWSSFQSKAEGSWLDKINIFKTDIKHIFLRASSIFGSL